MMYKIFLTILLSFISSGFVLADETLIIDEGYRINLSPKIDDEEEVELDDVKLVQTLVLVGVFITITAGVIRKIYFGEKSKDPYYKKRLENIYLVYQDLSKRLDANLVANEKKEFMNITSQISATSDRLINILNALIQRSRDLEAPSLNIKGSILKIKESNTAFLKTKLSHRTIRSNKSRILNKSICLMLNDLKHYIRIVKNIAHQEG
jgi:hypothetical protein